MSKAMNKQYLAGLGLYVFCALVYEYAAIVCAFRSNQQQLSKFREKTKITKKQTNFGKNRTVQL